MKKLLLALLLIAVPSFGAIVNPRAQRVRIFTSDPAVCAEGDVGFNVTTNLYKFCHTTNTWSTFAGTATTVVGPALSTDLALARWDGATGLLLQNGVLTSADWNGDLTGPSALDTTTGVGLAFGNQPANDGVEIVSDNAVDTTQTWTIIGTTNGVDTVVVETGTLNGTTFVPTVKVDWGLILAVKLSASAAGTVTVREASADATITTLATTVLSAGVETVLAADQSAWNRTVSLVSDGATTKQLGLKGTNSAGTVIYDSQALSGTTAVLSNSAFATVTEIYTGDLEAARTATETATGGTKLDGSLIVTEAKYTWATPAFNAGDFTGGGTWTVDAGDVTTYAYIEIGKTMTVAWQIVNTDINASTALMLKVPNGRTVAKTMRTATSVVDAGGAVTAGIAIVTAAGTNIELYRVPVAAWTNTAADNTSLYGQITFEIQ